MIRKSSNIKGSNIKNGNGFCKNIFFLKAVTVSVKTYFFFENAQFLLSSAALLKTKIEGGFDVLGKRLLEIQ